MNSSRARIVFTTLLASALLTLTFGAGIKTASAISPDACTYINGGGMNATNQTPGSGPSFGLLFVGDEVITAHATWVSGASAAIHVWTSPGPSVTQTVPVSGSADAVLVVSAPGNPVFGVDNTGGAGGNDSWTVTCAHGGGASGSINVLFGDGRVNNAGPEAAQTAAIYCDKGGVDVYAVWKGVGYFAFSVTKAELDAVPAMPAVNTLIKGALGVRLYRLTSGQLQINAATSEPPKEYVFIWKGC